MTHTSKKLEPLGGNDAASRDFVEGYAAGKLIMSSALSDYNAGYIQAILETRPAPDRMRAALRWIAGQRDNENADLDEICSVAERAQRLK